MMLMKKIDNAAIEAARAELTWSEQAVDVS